MEAKQETKKEMKIVVLRRPSHEDHGGFTIGEFFIDNKKMCYTLEDEYRKIKVPGETRIPSGIYEVELYTQGTMHPDYLKHYGAAFHKGMLHIKNVPGFDGVLIHVGNTDIDTRGCLLLGMQEDEKNGKIISSRAAYEKAYPIIAKALKNGYKVTIEIKNK